MTEAEAVAALARASGATVVTGPHDRHFLIVPQGSECQEITDPYGLKPRVPAYIERRVRLETSDSLVTYVNRFKSENTILFAHIEGNTIVAAIDYHGPGAPAHVAHWATLELPFSEEWRTWSAISGKLLPQLEFARFLEENAADVRAPSAGELLDACRDLQVRRKVNFIKAVRTASDNENFEYCEETNATTKRGELELPAKFVLGLPVYFGEREVELHAFLRWRLDEGSLQLGVQLHRAEHVRQAVFKQIVISVAADTKCLVAFGAA